MLTMKRLLFLDFDGVRHPEKPGESLPFEWVPEVATLLSEAPDVMIAVHSSWAERFQLDELREFLGPVGSRLVGSVGPGPKASRLSSRRTSPGHVVRSSCRSAFF